MSNIDSSEDSNNVMSLTHGKFEVTEIIDWDEENRVMWVKMNWILWLGAIIDSISDITFQLCLTSQVVSIVFI